MAAQLIEAARSRGTHIYERINITAAREFQRRRKNDAYEASSLGIEEDSDGQIQEPKNVSSCETVKTRKKWTAGPC